MCYRIILRFQNATVTLLQNNNEISKMTSPFIYIYIYIPQKEYYVFSLSWCNYLVSMCPNPESSGEFLQIELCSKICIHIFF